MIVVGDILEEVAEALGNTKASTSVIFRRLNRAVELLSSKGDWDPLLDCIDVCVHGATVSLPSFVSTVLAVSTEGVPLIGRDRFFEFHQNGPGYETPGESGRKWRELGYFPTMYEIGETARRLVALSDASADVGKVIRVFGLDGNGLRLTTTADGVTTDGIDIPIATSYQAASESLPKVLVIERVVKPVTVGRVRLFSDLGSADDNELLARFEHEETSPKFLRIELGVTVDTARIWFRHATAKIVNEQSVIRLHNVMALLNAVKAVRYYLQDDPEQGQAYESVATRMLQEQETVRQPPNHSPMSMSKSAGVFDPADQLD